jgi:hypothetical protein
MVAHGVFDSEALSLMQAALDQAWAALPPDQQTAETRERIAQAVLMLAKQWSATKASRALASLSGEGFVSASNEPPAPPGSSPAHGRACAVVHGGGTQSLKPLRIISSLTAT